MRHEFDGVLDGLIYGVLIGFGFAMTENFFYFIGAFDEGGFVNLTAVIILRSVVFGLNHAFYTSLTGIGFGLGAAPAAAVRLVDRRRLIRRNPRPQPAQSRSNVRQHLPCRLRPQPGDCCFRRLCLLAIAVLLS